MKKKSDLDIERERYSKRAQINKQNSKNFQVKKDPAKNCLDVAIVTDQKLKSKKQKKN